MTLLQVISPGRARRRSRLPRDRASNVFVAPHTHTHTHLALCTGFGAALYVRCAAALAYVLKIARTHAWRLDFEPQDLPAVSSERMRRACDAPSSGNTTLRCGRWRCARCGQVRASQRWPRQSGLSKHPFPFAHNELSFAAWRP